MAVIEKLEARLDGIGHLLADRYINDTVNRPLASYSIPSLPINL